MQATEVSPWRWGERFDPRVLRVLLDSADATNDQALALAEAHLMGQRATTTLEQLARSVDDARSRRHAAAQRRYHAADEYTDQMVRLYADEALRFACLTARLLQQLEAGAEPSTLTVDDLSELRPSALYADWTVVPSPPVDDEVGIGDNDDLSLSRAYAKILDALQIQRQDPARRRDGLDVGAVRENPIDVWAMGGVDLAQALHQYGQLCLWRLAKDELPPASRE